MVLNIFETVTKFSNVKPVAMNRASTLRLINILSTATEH